MNNAHARQTRRQQFYCRCAPLRAIAIDPPLVRALLKKDGGELSKVERQQTHRFFPNCEGSNITKKKKGEKKNTMPEKVGGVGFREPVQQPLTLDSCYVDVRSLTRYGKQDYWDDRYTQEPTSFEWYQGYWGLKPILEKHVPKDASILQIGVGTSRIQEDMVKDGYKRVVNIDYSSVVIDHMKKLHEGMPELIYRVADSRHMDCFPSQSFETVLDKGTLDAILCGETSVEDSANMLQECSRVLNSTGAYILITYGDPRSRLAYLAQPEFGWSVSVYYCVKEESNDNPNYNKTQDRHICGPFPPTPETMDELCILNDVHYVYVCRKGLPEISTNS
ncbi:hypothetical protein BSKO_10332 [Bryopsis sp. KO-2023]|nr:hypothetical protein BSKO_10332 [Bryopsis sp. KO-2023]